MDVSRSVTEFWKIWLSGGAVLLALAWPRIAPRWRTAALWALVGLSTLNYARYGLESLVERVDAYDLVHYYVNAKYFDELGYYDLIPCLILVEEETGESRIGEDWFYLAQHIGGHVVNPIEHGLARARHVRATRFEPVRWRQFEHDVRVLTRDEWRGGPDLYRQLLVDHGYNGTPAWTLIGKPLTHLVPVERVKWLGYLDLFLLLAAILLVGWAWDRDAAGWVALFLLVSYSTRWPTVPWAYLRYDYVAGLIAATALLRKGRPLLAGMVGGWAAAVRLFPALWLWGLVSQAGLSSWRRQPIARPLKWFALGFALVSGGLVAGAAARFGPEQVGIHLENMKDHNDPYKLSSRRAGLALALTHNGQTLPKQLTSERRQTMARQRGPRLLLAGALLLVLGWALRARRREEAFGFGFLPLFLLTTASYYYYVVRVTLITVHAGDLERPRNRLALAWLFAIEVFCNWAEGAYPKHRMFLIGYLSWGLLAYAVALVGWLLWEASTEEPGG